MHVLDCEGLVISAHRVGDRLRLWDLWFPLGDGHGDMDWWRARGKPAFREPWQLYTKLCVAVTWLLEVLRSSAVSIAAMGDQDPVILASYGSHRGGVNALHFRPHMKHVVSGGADSAVLLWSLHCRPNLRHPVVRPYRFLGHQGPVYSVAVSPLDNVVASGSKDKTVRLWLPTVEAKSSVIKAHGGAVRTVAFSCDGRCLLTGSDDKTIKVWLVQGQKFLATLTGHINWVRSSEFHPDGGTIVSGSDDRTIRLWDLERHECLQQFNDGMGMINSVRFHPNGSLLGTGGSDNCVQIWDIRSKMLVQHYAANSGAVNSVCFHPSGNFLLSTCEDSTIRVWDLREGQLLYSLQGHEGPTLCAEFSPTGEYFASGSADEHVMLWRTNFDDSICLPQDGLVGPIHEEGPHIANCMACQCACTTSKDLADKILGGDTRTNIPEPKVKQTSADKVVGILDPDLSPCSGPSSHKSPPRQRSSPKHHRAQTPQRSPKKPCQALFEVRKENERFSHPPSREDSVAHSPTKKNRRSKSPEPSNSTLESFGRTLEHIVGQLEVLTRTVSLFEERLSHTEDKMLKIENHKKQRPRTVEA